MMVFENGFDASSIPDPSRCDNSKSRAQTPEWQGVGDFNVVGVIPSRFGASHLVEDGSDPILQGGSNVEETWNPHISVGRNADSDQPASGQRAGANWSDRGQPVLLHVSG